MAITPLLGCRTCGLPAQEHGTSTIHRFVRPRLPAATARYLGALQAESDPRARLRHGVGLLPTLVHGCHHASITTVSFERLEVRTASDGTSRRGDELQDELDEGPCVQAVRTGHSVVAHDLSTETRWVDWCAAAAEELPVRSVLSILLVATPLPIATLNLYSDVVNGLSGVDIAFLHTLAEPLADALLDGRTTSADRLGPAA
jgi:GAF domain-containing protein